MGLQSPVAFKRVVITKNPCGIWFKKILIEKSRLKPRKQISNWQTNIQKNYPRGY